MNQPDAPQAPKNNFNLCLKHALERIHQEECPQIQNHPNCKKRASVAVVLRYHPVFPQQAVYDSGKLSTSVQTFHQSLDSFFSQTWVQQGNPEVLFIKRAARVGDRWTSHIALPGGKKEPGDSSDRMTSIRETREETGVELDRDHYLYIGNLPERTITTAWGKVPLMVLCPFVYLQMRYDVAPLALQPSEVHSAHWVPLEALISPSLRCNVRCDVSDRFTRQRRPFLRMMLRAICGQLIFSAVKLKPSESLYSRPIPEAATEDQSPTLFRTIVTSMPNVDRSDTDDQPLLLWGLTLGVMADLLELLDRPATSKLWSWPTFSPWDIRAVVWLLNRRFQSRKIREIRTVDSSGAEECDNVQIGGLDNTTYSTSVKRQSNGSEAGVAGMTLLAGYMDRLRGAVIVALFLRGLLGTAFASYMIRKFRGRSR